jgi:hypothetical protein
MPATMTAKRARELFDYDLQTGVLSWRSTGLPAGRSSTSHPYLVVYADRQKLYVHRLAWLWMTGEWPAVVDHIDGDSLRNAWANLRNTSQAWNMQNRHRPNARKRPGLLGVKQRTPTTWQAQLRLNKRTVHLGTFDSPEAAHAAYLAGKRQLHPGCSI